MRKKDKLPIKWKVAEKPTGRYRAFAYRSWPTATYGETMVAALYVDSKPSMYLSTSYSAGISESTPLIVHIADHRGDKWEWRRLKGRPVGVTAAKKLVDEFFKQNPDFWEAILASR